MRQFLERILVKQPENPCIVVVFQTSMFNVQCSMFNVHRMPSSG